jgi:cyclopropane fatty-acyl-phospholipid synthase-like methyltransferase
VERDAMAGMKLLEIGFGFGSLAYFLATKYDVQITAVTLSKAQMEPWQR